MLVDEAVFADEYLPETLLHREGAVEVLARAFEPALDGERPGDVLIHGPHGVGKTVCARHTFDRLEVQAQADVHYAHVRTMGESTAGVVRATLNALGADPSQTAQREDLALKLREYVDEPTVIVCDEAGEIPAKALARLMDTPLVGVVPIIHNPDEWYSRLDDERVRHRLVGQELGLDRYSTAELADILEPRAREGLQASVDRVYLEQVADRAAGVARTAIQTLRAAGMLANEYGCPVETIAVDRAYERALRRVREASLHSLPFHHHVLYELVREAGGITAEALHTRYDEIDDEVYRGRGQRPVGERTRRYKLRKLQEYDLIAFEGETRGRRYAPVDPDVKSALVTLPTRVSPRE